LKGRKDRIQALRGKEGGKEKESGKYLIFIRKGRLERLTLSSQKQKDLSEKKGNSIKKTLLRQGFGGQRFFEIMK
jgi:hypothetical protein